MAADARAARGWVPTAGLFAFALAVRLVYLHQIGDTDFFRVPVGDGASYEEWADAIRRDVLGTEVFYQAPLYPYLLAALYAVFGHGPMVARAAQAVLGAGACVLVASAGRRLFSRGVGLGAGVLLAAYGPALFFGGIIQKACLDLFLTAALLWALARLEGEVRGRDALLAGVILGALALTRENALALVVVIAAWLGWWLPRVEQHDARTSPRDSGERSAPQGTGEGSGVAIEAQGPSPLPSPRSRGARANGGRWEWRPVLSFLGGVLLLLGPVALRNYRVGGAALPTTSQFGVNFYLGNHEGADGLYQPLRWGHGSFALERADAIQIAEAARGRALAPNEVASFWFERSRAWIAAHPGDWLRLLARKWTLLWNDREIPDSDEPLVYQDASPLLRVAAAVLSFGVLMPLALVGLAATWRDRRRLLVLYLVLAAFALSAALFCAFARYRVPLLPVLALFASAGAAHLVAAARVRRWRALGAAAAVLVAGAWFARRPVETESDPRATAHYNLAVSLEARGEPERAVAAYRRALLADADFEPAHVNLGAALARAGALPEAVAHERAALRLMPDDPTAHTDLANALVEQGHLDDAEPHYREALRLSPGFASAQQGWEWLRELRARRAAAP